MLANSLTRDRLRIGLVLIILATIPFYCGGLIAVELSNQPTATPTLTNTPLPSETPTLVKSSPYPTFTASVTLAGPSDTPIPTATSPQTDTPIPSGTSTATATASETPIPTSSRTLTNTPTRTASSTATLTPTRTPTATRTNTVASPSHTPTPTETQAIIETPTPTNTSGPDPTIIITIPPSSTPPDG